MSVVQMKEAADFREVKLKGKNHILKTGHYRLKNELKSDHKKVEQLQEQVSCTSIHYMSCDVHCSVVFWSHWRCTLSETSCEGCHTSKTL